jgi:hypothetical protein
MRNVIQQELHSPSLNDPSLAEVLGVRLHRLKRLVHCDC